MAGAGADRISAIAGRHELWGGSRSPRKGSKGRSHEGALNTARRKGRKEEPEENVLPLTLTDAIEQWVCLVLGIIPREKIFDHSVDPRAVLLDYTKGVDSLSQLRDIERAIEHPTR